MAVSGIAKGRVLVIAGYAPSLTNFRLPLLRAIRDANYEVIAAAPNDVTFETARRSLMSEGIRCRIISLNRTSINPVANVRTLLSLVRLIRAERPKAILAYTAKPVIFGLLAGSIAGVTRRYGLITGLGYAFTGRMTPRRALTQLFSRVLFKAAFKRATKVFFQNPDDASLFRELGLIGAGLPVAIVNGSGVDLNHFRQMEFPTGPPKFLLIARLLAAKGIREYAAAARLVKNSYPEAEFHLVGGHDSNPDGLPTHEVLKWEREGIMTWHGHVTEVRPFLADCHVYVLPSYREGTPRTVLEALATGRPVITSDAPGCRQTVIDGENGFLVPPQSIEELARAMIRFIESPELLKPLGARSRELAEDRFDVVKVNAHMMREMELD